VYKRQILHCDRPELTVTTPEWLDWQTEQLNLDAIAEILTTQQPDLLGIKAIPNPRLTSEILLLEKIEQFDGTVADLKTAIAPTQLGIEPEACHTLVRDLPYTSFIQSSPTGFANYDVIFQRNIDEKYPLPRFIQEQKLSSIHWQEYANQPWQYGRDRLPNLITEWRDFLAKTLPDYMIPSQFTVLEKLPLTSNGKIDRQALPTVDLAVASTAIELPITPTETILAQLWIKLLKYIAIDRQDNFFNLGGHSLLATQLTARIRDTFQIELPLRKIFEYPTLSGLANYLDSCIWVHTSIADLQPLNPEEEEIEL
jgi:acyl carrier protein